jgi:hypothetical protein
MIANVQSPASKFKRAGLVLAMASGVLGATSAWADPELRSSPVGLYFSINGGLAPSHRVCNGLANDQCDHVSFAHKFTAGWNAYNDVALEVSYLYFNGIDRNYQTSQNAVASRERVTDRALMAGIDWHIELLNYVTNHIRVGIARAERATTTSYRAGGSAVSEDYKTVPYLGAGFSYPLNDFVQFNMGFDYIFNNEASRHILSLGATASF